MVSLVCFFSKIFSIDFWKQKENCAKEKNEKRKVKVLTFVWNLYTENLFIFLRNQISLFGIKQLQKDIFLVIARIEAELLLFFMFKFSFFWPF